MEAQERRQMPRTERAKLITVLNQNLSAIKRGEMPADGREDILARKRALSAEQTAANRIAKRGY